MEADQEVRQVAELEVHSLGVGYWASRLPRLRLPAVVERPEQTGRRPCLGLRPVVWPDRAQVLGAGVRQRTGQNLVISQVHICWFELPDCLFLGSFCCVFPIFCSFWFIQKLN